MTRNHGFTLIEMLVAIGILAVIALIGWRGLDGIVRARDAVTAEIQRQRGLQAAFAQLEADLRLVARDPSDTTSLPGIRFSGTGDIMVLRQVPVASDGHLRYQLVRWQLDGGRYLRRVRDVRTPDEARALAGAATWPDATEQVLVEGLTQLSTRLWDPTAARWVPPAGSGADAIGRAQALAAPGPVLPAAVEVVLTTVDGDVFRRAVLVRE